jgi:type IV pilus assembly protein PilA
MFEPIRSRIEQPDEEGFTLIELMVVVLIIAILLAIAIPTFLGARSKAQDRAAQSILRNALTAEKTYYVDNQAYTDNTSSNLTKIEPSLTYTGSVNPVIGTVAVTVSLPGDSVILATKSASGKCFYLQDSTAAATQYEADTACGLDAAGAYAARW